MTWTGATALRLWVPDWSGRFAKLTGATNPPWLVIPVVWFVLIVPAIVLRGYHYEEGTVIALARGAIEDGHWLTPHLYGVRFVERPVLMSWLLGLLGLVLGGIDQWVARLLPVSSLLGGGALIFYLVQQRASVTAAVFAAVCFMVSPALLQKTVTAEPDVMLSAILFAAFVLWWNGKTAGRFSTLRWIGIGLVLAGAALTKGPQPVAFFTFGIGCFITMRRQWADVRGFVLAHAVAGASVGLWYLAIYRPGDLAFWALHGRFHVRTDALEYLLGLGRYFAQVGLENLPGILVAAPLAITAFRQRLQRPDDLVLALTSYAVACTVFIALFPGRGARYAMPAVPAIAALAGIAYDELRSRRVPLLDISVGIAFILTLYAVVLSWLVMPAWPERFQRSWIEAKAMIAAMGTAPRPLYSTLESIDKNVVAYLPGRIRIIAVDDFARVQAPSFAYIAPAAAAEVRGLRPDLSVIEHAVIEGAGRARLYELQPR